MRGVQGKRNAGLGGEPGRRVQSDATGATCYLNNTLAAPDCQDTKIDPTDALRRARRLAIQFNRRGDFRTAHFWHARYLQLRQDLLTGGVYSPVLEVGHG